MYYTVLLQYFCHQFFHKAYKIVMNIINLEGGGVQLNPLNPPLATALCIILLFCLHMLLVDLWKHITCPHQRYRIVRDYKYLYLYIRLKWYYLCGVLIITGNYNIKVIGCCLATMQVLLCVHRYLYLMGTYNPDYTACACIGPVLCNIIVLLQSSRF